MEMGCAATTAEETAEGAVRCWPPHTHFFPSFLMLFDLHQSLFLKKFKPKRAWKRADV